MKFDEWGRYVMLWHDGRFMRHTRFRYCLLDIMLRVMVLGVHRILFRKRQAADNYTLESLVDKNKWRELVQASERSHAASVGAQLPNSSLLSDEDSSSDSSDEEDPARCRPAWAMAG